MKRTSISRLAVVAVLALTLVGCGSSDSDEPGASATDSTAPAADSTLSSSDASVAAAETAAPVTEPATDTAAPTTDTAAPTTDPAVPATDIAPDAPPVTALAAGPVSVVALGDSLTYGEGDDLGLGGFAGRLTESIGATPGREGSSLVNLGVSGWHSTGMVEGQDGSPAQLPAAVEAVQAAVAEGQAVLATVLIGSNDLTFLYAYGPPEGTTSADEDAAAETYRSNLDRTVTELSQAGALVVLGLPDDQTLRPFFVDIDLVHTVLPDVTVEELEQMSAMSVRLDGIVADVAAEHGLRTVDTNSPFWADTATMADDLIHPNSDGYAALADLWIAAIQDLL